MNKAPSAVRCEQCSKRKFASGTAGECQICGAEIFCMLDALCDDCSAKHRLCYGCRAPEPDPTPTMEPPDVQKPI